MEKTTQQVYSQSYHSRGAVRMMKSRTKWAAHSACMGTTL